MTPTTKFKIVKNAFRFRNMFPPINEFYFSVIPTRWLSELEYFLPNLFELTVLLQVLDADGINSRRANFFRGFYFGMSRSSSSLSVNRLPFRGRSPAGKQPSRIGMWRAFENRYRDNAGNTLRQHVIERRAFPDAGRVMVRVTREAGGGLPGDEKLRQLRVAFV